MSVRDLTPFDVFRHCDTQNRGGISGPGLWGGLTWLGLEALPDDILDLFDSFDADRDGLLNYREFLEMTRPPGPFEHFNFCKLLSLSC
jgi:Ca2+-binding EF-hand superfamily protein